MCHSNTNPLIFDKRKLIKVILKIYLILQLYNL